MQREKLQELIRWKTNPIRKPLILQGARQVGKTWLLQEFGRTAYKKCIYVNFEDTPSLQPLFQADFDTERIINALQIFSQQTITPEDTLIIFDEIQEAERGITSLKYFCEKTPQYHIVAAGSLLGMNVHQHVSFPVGKVDFMNLHPLSFTEFLDALNEKGLSEILKKPDWQTISIFRNKLIENLKYYFYTGGMPEVVFSFSQKKDFQMVRHIQQRILLSYEGDFSKHAPAEIVPRIRMVWQSIAAQLAKENKKFVYNVIREGARAKDFELAIQWLTDCGLLHKCQRISKPGMPLSAYQDFPVFKLFMHDIGLLAAKSGIPMQSLIEGDTLFTEFKGALTEQFVMQELSLNSNRLVCYWTNDRSTSEVDFVIQDKEKLIPIEVKSSENLKARSFKFFCEKYQPETAIRTSLSDYKQESWMTNVPLYGLIGFIENL